MTLYLAARILLAACAALALSVARRSPGHRPLAVTLAALLAADLIRWRLGPLWSTPGPYAGSLRAAFHLDQMLLILWRWSIAACLWWTLGSRRGMWATLGIGAAIGIGCAAAYPWLRQEPLFAVYAWVHFAASSASLLAVLARLVGPRRIPRGAEIPALILASGSAAQTFGVWFGPEPDRWWWLARLGSVLVYAVVGTTLLWQGFRNATGGPDDA